MLLQNTGGAGPEGWKVVQCRVAELGGNGLFFLERLMFPMGHWGMYGNC